MALTVMKAWVRILVALDLFLFLFLLRLFLFPFIIIFASLFLLFFFLRAIAVFYARVGDEVFGVSEIDRKGVLLLSRRWQSSTMSSM
jgi:hypothetical protein